jgi:hypothetical protein
MAFHWNSLFDSSDEQGAACAALAISMCPNLEELHLRYNGYGTTKHAEPWPLRLFTDQSVGGAASKMLQKICGNLRTLRFSRLDRRLGPIGDIRVLPHVPFVEVPSLNHLEISGAREQHYTISRAGAVWDAFLSRHVDASLEKFVLRETEMPFPLLESILRSCHGLKEFYYEMAASVYHDRKIKFDYARLCRAMEQHRTSLESLSINFFDGSAHRVFDFVDQTAPSFLNLSDFPRLKTVRASVNALLPETIQNVSTRLPLSLERLELFSADEEDWKTFLPLERFIQRDLAIFPKLQCISVLSPDPDFMYWADTKMRLAEQGVSLIVE